MLVISIFFLPFVLYFIVFNELFFTFTLSCVLSTIMNGSSIDDWNGFFIFILLIILIIHREFVLILLLLPMMCVSNKQFFFIRSQFQWFETITKNWHFKSPHENKRKQDPIRLIIFKLINFERNKREQKKIWKEKSETLQAFFT